MEISVVGIDLAKNSFSVCEVSKSAKVIRRLEFSRSKLIEYSSQLPRTLIAFEACGGSHFWARLFISQGHQVKMMSSQRVKPFAPPQKKNDASDAEAIAVAALSESVPSVRTKSVEQQDLEMLLNFRNQLVKQKVALINQAHAVALEYGLNLPRSKFVTVLDRLLSELEISNNHLTVTAREVLHALMDHAKKLQRQADEIEARLKKCMRENEQFKLLNSIPGVGTLTAVAILAHTGGDMSCFKNGRHFAAYLGLVPRQYSTGGKARLLGITRCGSSEIRRLLVLGTTSVMRLAAKREDRISRWVLEKRKARGYRKANVALANKTARIVYGVLSSQQSYKIA